MVTTRSAKKRANLTPRAAVDDQDPIPAPVMAAVGSDGDDDKEKVWKGEAGGVHWIRNTVLTLLTMVYSQVILMVWYVIKEHGGSFQMFFEKEVGCSWAILSGDFQNVNLKGFAMPFIHPTKISTEAWAFIVVSFAIAIVLMKLVPGGEHKGPVTPTGHVPVYTANGVQCFLLHCLLFVLGSIQGPLGENGLYSLSIVYDQLGDILNGLNYFALAFTLFLYVKGHYFPTGKDGGTTGNLVLDLYWGMELYPRIFGIDVKQWTNCRFGMMYWAICTISCAQASIDHSCDNAPAETCERKISPAMLSSVILQLIYIFKFFWWETGYFNSIDIMEDRAGYYICWGCLCYLPTTYTSMTTYMVENPGTTDLPMASLVILAGIIAIYINYDSDRQRADFRRACKVDHVTGKVTGEYMVWGKPAEYIVASYTTTDGTPRKSLLLLSGYWGITRHFHYIPELSAAFFWSCGAGFNHFMPFFYTVYLTILLMDRSVRDDKRCRDKYQSSWGKYCEQVPSKVFPGIF